MESIAGFDMSAVVEQLSEMIARYGVSVLAVPL